MGGGGGGGEGGEYFPILKLISMGLLKDMVLEPLWSGNGYGFSLLMVLHRVWLSRQTKNHVFVRFNFKRINRDVEVPK